MKECKILQYAGDTFLGVADEHLMSVIDRFTKCTGLKMNWGKTEPMPIGSSSNCRYKQNKVKWTQNPIKYLGVSKHKNPDIVL